MKYKKINSSDTNVSKFVFEGDDIAVESVLYRYNSYKERTVICCSTQCGCPVGCSFCGTGKFFKRNLTSDEIIEQITSVLSTIDCKPSEIKKFQIMFMSMGEPFLNYYNLKQAIIILNRTYPTAQLLVSTSAPISIDKVFIDFINLSIDIKNIGIQFSVHESLDVERHKLIPTKTASIKHIGILGGYWCKCTNRRPYFNYCVHKGNNTQDDVDRLAEALPPSIWENTLSVICEKDDTVANSINNQIDLIKDFSTLMCNKNYSTRTFNPAGQDDIGGGCGQLWYFQEWAKKQKKENENNK